MKRLIIVLATLFLALSCQKSTLSKGLYFTDTSDGIIYIELLRGDDCLVFFQGQEKDNGYYKIAKGEINLMGQAKTTSNGRSISWWFGGSLGPGKINGNTFYIKGMRTSGTKIEYKYMTFYKH